MANRSERIITGHVAVGTLTSTYTIRNFTKQSDQPAMFPWACNSTPPRRPRLRPPLSGNDRRSGGYVSQFIFKYMTFKMYDFWMDNYFTTGMSYGNVTVMIYERDDVAVFMQCKIHEPAELNKFALGFENVVFPLRFGVIIT